MRQNISRVDDYERFCQRTKDRAGLRTGGRGLDRWRRSGRNPAWYRSRLASLYVNLRGAGDIGEAYYCPISMAGL